MTKHDKTILVHFISTHHTQPSFLHWLMQTLGLGTKALFMVIVFGIKCAPFYDNLNQSHIEFQMQHCFCELRR